MLVKIKLKLSGNKTTFCSMCILRQFDSSGMQFLFSECIFDMGNMITGKSMVLNSELFTIFNIIKLLKIFIVINGHDNKCSTSSLLKFPTFAPISL